MRGASKLALLLLAVATAAGGRLDADAARSAAASEAVRAVGAEYLKELTEEIATESLRYSVDIPGQALAYKMGSRGLWELRKKAETALGPRFDVRRFHDCILGSGSLPLSALGRKVDAFIEKEKAR